MFLDSGEIDHHSNDTDASLCILQYEPVSSDRVCLCCFPVLDCIKMAYFADIQ